MAERGNVLPTSLPPRGLSRVQSAAYIGVSPTLFDEMVKDGRIDVKSLITKKYGHEQINEALEDLEHGKLLMGISMWN